jgi:hypothetical protein
MTERFNSGATLKTITCPLLMTRDLRNCLDGQAATRVILHLVLGPQRERGTIAGWAGGNPRYIAPHPLTIFSL